MTQKLHIPFLFFCALLLANTSRAHSIGQPRFIVMEVLDYDGKVLICKLAFEKQSHVELICFSLEQSPPTIQWRQIAKSHDLSACLQIAEKLYTIEGSTLRERSLQNGEIKGEVNLNYLVTPTSRKKPWDAKKEQLAERKQQAKTNPNNPELREEIQVLSIDIQAMQQEWKIREEMAKAVASPDSASTGHTGFFLNAVDERLIVMRKKSRYIPGGFQTLYRERLLISTDPLKAMKAKEVKKEEWHTFRKRGLTKTMDFTLHVLSEHDIDPRLSEKDSTEIIIMARDKQNPETRWRMSLPIPPAALVPHEQD